MILLIRHLAWPAPIPLAKFKFHYDSINSSKYRHPDCKAEEFKFHYDSINSFDKTVSIESFE